MLILWPIAPASADIALAPAPACQKPDDTLIKSRGGYEERIEMADDEKIQRYNAEVRAFNDCTRKLIDSNHAEMDRIRDDGNAAIRSITQTASRQNGDIAEKIEAAIAGQAPPAAGAQSGMAGWQFPAAECAAPGKPLLKPERGRKSATVARTAQFDTQQQFYRVCVQDYIGQARGEMQEIEASANARIKDIAAQANGRITELSNQVRSAIDLAGHAANDEIQAARGTPYEINPGNYITDGVENVIVQGTPPEQLTDSPKGDGDPHTIVCRKPQQLPDSRLMGPEICKRNRVRAALYEAGEDIRSDGQTIVASEKSRTIDHAAMNCVKITTGSLYQGYITNEYCN